MDRTDLTLYLVGYTEDDARESLPFDSIESAQSYADDQGGDIYSVTATIDLTTIQIEG